MRIPKAWTTNVAVAGFAIAIVFAVPSTARAQEDLGGAIQDLKDRWGGDAQRRAVEEGVDPGPASPSATSEPDAASQLQGAAGDAGIAAGEPSATSAKDRSNQGIDTPQDNAQPPSSDSAEPAPLSVTPNEEP